MIKNNIHLIEFKEDTNISNKYTFEENDNILKLSTELDFSKEFQKIKKNENEDELITSQVQYIEIKIKGEYPNVSIGMSSHLINDRTQHIGRETETIGYYSNDGKVYIENVESAFKLPFNEDDIIGCGYTTSPKQIFFTKNGDLLQIFPFKKELKYFAIGIEEYEEIEINNGSEKPFKFDIQEFCKKFEDRKSDMYVTKTIKNDIISFYVTFNKYVSLRPVRQVLLNYIESKASNNKMDVERFKIYITENYFDINKMAKDLKYGHLCERFVFGGIEPCKYYIDHNQDMDCYFQTAEDYEESLYEDDFDDCGFAKPVILLYDNEKKENEEVTIKLKLNEDMDIGMTYPHPIVLKEEMKEKEYEWKGKYTSKGNEENCKIEIEGKIYDYVFWEGVCLNKESFKGEIIGISKEKLVEDLEVLLEKLGMNEREINDFIVYWLTKLSLRKGHKVTICNNYYDNTIAKLEVNGFEKIHRIVLQFEEIDDVSQLATVESIGRKERPTGKYVIEWGANLI